MSRLLVPSLEREIRRELKDRAENHAVVVFARNLRSKLLAAPLRGKKVLAIDPAFRTGCKLAVLNEQGDLVADGVIFPHAPQNKKGQARNRLREMLCRHKIQVIAIGNGTACRETEELVSDLLAEFETRRQNPEGFWANLPGASEAPPPVEVPEASITTAAPIESPSIPDSAGINPASEAQASAEVPVSTSESPGQHPADNPANPESSASESAPTPVPSLGEEAGAPPNPQADSTPVVPESSEPLPEPITDLAYVIVNEAGASVYSASPVGREEFPQFDATLRGTISIGRRLQDPLSELVKIDPQHVGVGLYQHDVSPKHLRESLDAIIESCVNTVGVDLNTASVPLLRHVSGLNALVAQRLVEWRKQNGPFRRREQLREIPGIGERTFEQAAGFLKIQGGEEPLDTTWIHPESYPVARQILGEMGLEPAILSEKDRLTDMQEKVKALSPAEIANRLQVGVPTVEDILESLARPGRDPREDLPTPVFKKGILKLEDLQPGMELKGTVLNVVDFGAFIDIGLKDSGLVHISQMANRFVKSPYDLVSVGDVVQVWVMAVDNQRHRVSLTMISPGTERKPAEKRSPGPRRERREHPQPQGVDGVPNQAQGERGGRPPRPPRGPRPEGPRGPRQGDNTSAQQGERPPREGGGRPPREGERAPRGQRRDGPPRGAPQGTGAGKP
ncbi:MAG: helix-hairpin-helix domain-containing protein, partial [Gemmataceae bacterium]